MLGLPLEIAVREGVQRYAERKPAVPASRSLLWRIARRNGQVCCGNRLAEAAQVICAGGDPISGCHIEVRDGSDSLAMTKQHDAEVVEGARVTVLRPGLLEVPLRRVEVAPLQGIQTRPG